MKPNVTIGIAGNIGVGKTTFTEKLSKDLNLEPIYESVINNPYLSDFYDNMARWSFNLQIYFLYTRFNSQISLLNNKKGFIQAEGVVPTLSIGTYLLGSCLNTVVAV